MATSMLSQWMQKLKPTAPVGTRYVFTIKDMHCTSCALTIDSTLEDTPGVTRASTSYAKSQTEVWLDEQKIKPVQIPAILKEIGYIVSLKKS